MPLDDLGFDLLKKWSYAQVFNVSGCDLSLPSTSSVTYKYGAACFGVPYVNLVHRLSLSLDIRFCFPTPPPGSIRQVDASVWGS